jgi:hypothetical protein
MGTQQATGPKIWKAMVMMILYKSYLKKGVYAIAHIKVQK